MKRFHVHVAVPDLEASIQFYSTLFGAEPSVTKDDYAKWMLEDPRVNFAISQRGADIGINHLGVQVDSGEELEALHGQLEAADRGLIAEKDASCCYAKSDKYWVTDPAGIAWESFHTLGSIPMFGSDHREPAAANPRSAPEIATDDLAQRGAGGGCCTPSTETARAAQTSTSTACGCATTTVRAELPKTKNAACCG